MAPGGTAPAAVYRLVISGGVRGAIDLLRVHLRADESAVGAEAQEGVGVVGGGPGGGTLRPEDEGEVLVTVDRGHPVDALDLVARPVHRPRRPLLWLTEERDAVDRPGQVRTDDIGHGGNDVEGLGVAVVDHARTLARVLHEQRDPQNLGRVALADPAERLLVGEADAVVGGDHDEGVVPPRFGLQPVEGVAEQAVGVLELEEVTLAGLVGGTLVVPSRELGPPGRVGGGVRRPRAQVDPRLVGQHHVGDVEGRPSTEPLLVQRLGPADPEGDVDLALVLGHTEVDLPTVDSG